MDESPDELPEDPAPAPKPRRRAMLFSLTLAALLMLGAAAAAVGTGGTRHIVGSGAPDPQPANLALADPVTTDKIESVLGTAFAQLFAYDSRTPNQNEQDATTVLAGHAISQYRDVVNQYHTGTPATGWINVADNVLHTAVLSLSTTHAVALLFGYQATMVTGSESTTDFAVLVTVDRAPSGWQITNFDDQPYTEPDGRSAPAGPPVDTEQRIAALRDQALAAAEQDAGVLTTLDYTAVDAGLANWRAVATGNLLDELDSGRPDFIQQVVTGRDRTVGFVGAAGVATLDPPDDTATVLVAADVTVDSSGNRFHKQLPLVVTMKLTGGRWLVSDLTQSTV